MKSRNKYSTLIFSNVIFLGYAIFWANNSEYWDRFFISFFIHSSAFLLGLGLLQFQKLPFVIPFSIFNIVTYSIAPSIIDFNKFQLGVFDPKILDIFNEGFVILYFVYFLMVYYRKDPMLKTHISARIQSSNIKLLFLFFYCVTFFVTGLLSFLHVFATNWIFGILIYGFFKKFNSTTDNIVLLFLFLFETINIIVGGLIFPLFFFFFFLFLLTIAFNINLKKFTLPIVFAILAGSIFASSFSKVKMKYRNLELSGTTNIDKVLVINDLLNESEDNNIERENDLFWRLTYPLSGLSLVKNKTPESVPFWEGQSYIPIFYKFIPRIIWLNKPIEDMGQKFGHTYKILADDNMSTSMNCPMVAEAYMNFGDYGVWFFFVFYGILMANIYYNINQKNINVSNSIIEILNRINLCFVSVYFLQMESNFSMFFGKIVILQITMIVVNMFARKKIING
jgi:hypothetical protein